MTRKKFKVKDKEGYHEYTIVMEDKKRTTKYQLRRSKDSMWANNLKGTKIYQFFSDGNGFHISKMPKKKVDYHRAGELLILLTFMQKHYAIINATIQLPNKKKLVL
jgi:hypothetical protein